MELFIEMVDEALTEEQPGQRIISERGRIARENSIQTKAKQRISLLNALIERQLPPFL